MAHRPETAEGHVVWQVITACQRQIRMAPMGGAMGLDFGAVMAMGQALGADLGLLAEVLPDVEIELVEAIAAAIEDATPASEGEHG